MNKRLSGIDFIRCVSALIILFFHLNIALQTKGVETGFFYIHTNGEWGETAVTLFFMISGMGLYLRYKEKIDIKKYYIKRWISIYPLFYMVWGVCGQLLGMLFQKVLPVNYAGNGRILYVSAYQFLYCW